MVTQVLPPHLRQHWQLPAAPSESPATGSLKLEVELGFYLALDRRDGNEVGPGPYQVRTGINAT